MSASLTLSLKLGASSMNFGRSNDWPLNSSRSFPIMFSCSADARVASASSSICVGPVVVTESWGGELEETGRCTRLCMFYAVSLNMISSHCIV